MEEGPDIIHHSRFSQIPPFFYYRLKNDQAIQKSVSKLGWNFWITIARYVIPDTPQFFSVFFFLDYLVCMWKSHSLCSIMWLLLCCPASVWNSEKQWCLVWRNMKSKVHSHMGFSCSVCHRSASLKFVLLEIHFLSVMK